jgi:hypothetical protein
MAIGDTPAVVLRFDMLMSGMIRSVMGIQMRL